MNRARSLIDELSAPVLSRAEYKLRDMAPDSSRSGEHRVLQRYGAEEESSKVVKSSPSNELPRPVAKAVPSEKAYRELLNEEPLADFRHAVDGLRHPSRGWSWDRLARLLKCTQTALKDMYDGHRLIGAWALYKLLAELRKEPEGLRGTRRVG